MLNKVVLSAVKLQNKLAEICVGVFRQPRTLARHIGVRSGIVDDGSAAWEGRPVIDTAMNNCPNRAGDGLPKSPEDP